jgi:hypothetical protein
MATNMKSRLQEIHNQINDIFNYNIETYRIYKTNVEEALELIKSIPDQNNLMLTNWKNMGVDELQKELNGRLSADFLNLSPDDQKSTLKFSKMAVSVVLMNIIMHL